MSHRDTHSPGVLSSGAEAASYAVAYPAAAVCRQCSGRTGGAYTLCRDCLESLPDDLCTSQVLEALVR